MSKNWLAMPHIMMKSTSAVKCLWKWGFLSWYWGKKLKIWSPQAKNWASECIYGDLINNLGYEHFVSGCMLRHFSVPPTVSQNHRKVLLCWQDVKQTLLETPFYTNKIGLGTWIMSWSNFIQPLAVYKSSGQSEIFLCSKWWETGTSRAGFIPPVWNTCLKRARSEFPFQMGVFISIWCIYTSSADRQKYSVLLLSLSWICSEPRSTQFCHWSRQGWAQLTTKSFL